MAFNRGSIKLLVCPQDSEMHSLWCLRNVFIWIPRSINWTYWSVLCCVISAFKASIKFDSSIPQQFPQIVAMTLNAVLRKRLLHHYKEISFISNLTSAFILNLESTNASRCQIWSWAGLDLLWFLSRIGLHLTGAGLLVDFFWEKDKQEDDFLSPKNQAIIWNMKLMCLYSVYVFLLAVDEANPTSLQHFMPLQAVYLLESKKTDPE